MPSHRGHLRQALKNSRSIGREGVLLVIHIAPNAVFRHPFIQSLVNCTLQNGAVTSSQFLRAEYRQMDKSSAAFMTRLPSSVKLTVWANKVYLLFTRSRALPSDSQQAQF